MGTTTGVGREGVAVAEPIPIFAVVAVGDWIAGLVACDCVGFLMTLTLGANATSARAHAKAATTNTKIGQTDFILSKD